jgi:hypothetical protein
VQSAKKNGEFNIINNFFSFILSTTDSHSFLATIARTLVKEEPDIYKIISIISKSIRLINLRRKKKYINKVILMQYFARDSLQEMFAALSVPMVVSYEQLSLLLRKCFYHYLDHISLTSILTSKRTPIHSKHVHLLKRRRMRSFVGEHMKSR